ncbi:REP-associated tyrosine transposase [Conchiformibius kuhniae]|uniref:Transposase n=1 Tax=Conchiformibius kuhniae TaxID=211502 RepID=A0A8T9MVP3_9NEIS|nr:transposase [Conchiformibius kuhniae]UOP05194.1 transposase [Conchiformibius kuhniae]
MRYRRSLASGACYFFTLALHNRRQDLLVRHIADLRRTFSEVKQKYDFEIIAACILPEHLHLLMRLPPDDNRYPMRLRLIKSAFSRAIPKTEAVSLSRQRKNERGIWQRRYWEHEIRNQQDLNAHIDYIHFNPVKHGYVVRVKDWQYSSFHRYVRQGILPLDWAGSDVDGNFGE